MARNQGGQVAVLVPDTAAQRLHVSRRLAPYVWLEQKRVAITPEVAREYLDEYNTMDIQRDVKALTLSTLTSSALMNALREGTTIALYRAADDSLQLVNGQHTLLAISYAGITIELAVHIYGRRGRRSDLRAVCELYQTFDRATTGQRSMYDYARIMGLDKIFPTKTATNKWLHAAKPIAGGFTDTGLRVWRNEPEFILSVAPQYADEAKRYFALVAEPDELGSEKLTSMRTMPAMLVILKYAPRLARQFIQGVRDDSLRATDPRKRLRDLLLAPREETLLTSCRHYWSVMAGAWNSFVTHSPFRVDLQAPVEIARTPFRRGYTPPHPHHTTETMNALKQFAKSRGVPDRRPGSQRTHLAAARQAQVDA